MARDDRPDNMSKSQLSLEMGSEQYRRRQMDLLHMDAFEQEDVLQGKLRIPDQSADLEDRLAADDEAIKERRKKRKRAYEGHYAQTQSVRLKTNAERGKMYLVDDLEAKAIEEASLTPDMEDDKRARQIKRKSIDLVYDQGVDEDEFLPKALRKYL